MEYIALSRETTNSVKFPKQKVIQDIIQSETSLDIGKDEL